MQKKVLWILLVIAVAVIAALLFWRKPGATKSGDRFAQAMTLGQGYLQREDATNAIAQYSEAVRLAPENLDANLNLASAHLLAGNSEQVIEWAEKALTLDPNSAGAHYLIGCARMRLNQPELALQAFQNSQKIDPAVTALDFQLGLAHERLGQFEDAAREFETVIQFEPDHPSAHYQLSRVYQRLGRADDASAAMARHQEVLAKNPGAPSGVAAFEKSKHTQPRVAFTLAQPDPAGIPVKFDDATSSAFGQSAAQFLPPMAVIDYNHDGRNSLFVRQTNGFQLLENSNGQFVARGPALPATNATYFKALVGDLNNDRFEDIVVLGEQASHAFRFATNGQAREVTAAAGLRALRGRDGVLADLDFTGKLDLLTILPGQEGIRVHRNLGNFYFQDNTATSGLPAQITGVEHVLVDDWNNEDVPGVFFTRKDQPPIFYPKQRAGSFVQTNLPPGVPSGSVAVFADFNNDLRLDLAVLGGEALQVFLGSATNVQKAALNSFQAKGALGVDFDNDGWMDLLAWGDGLRLWRNKGNSGFEDVTAKTGLNTQGAATDVAVADFDNDGDTDLICASSAGLRYWRNEGGNAQRQLKVRLVGNRSNASGLGVRLEMVSGQWRSLRTVNRLPVEIGVGSNAKVEVLKTRWFDLATTVVDVPVEKQPLILEELTLPTGSCPYLYTWDGSKFRFVTDILGAAPLGLPISKTRYVEADPEEYLELGGTDRFVPKGDSYEVRITEELREVLYLDEAHLVAVDHPVGTLVLPTSKMLPGRPFLPHELWTLKPLSQVSSAKRHDGLDVTSQLQAVDTQMVGPVTVREPQLRGLAEPWSIEFAFPQIPERQPLVLVMNGWLRFGGGMANISGSIDPSLPFPFPVLVAQMSDGSWTNLPVAVGVPAGKTKTILVDLEGKLPSGVQRLKLSCAFEMYWDAISLAAKAPQEQTVHTGVSPSRAELQWHGYGVFEKLPPWLPLTPIYDEVEHTPQWSRTPAGWCTRYGDVRELLLSQDHAMVLLNGGDEVALSFPTNALPPLQDGFQRKFFLHVVGWDKDADFHVGQGWRVEPLPYVGMDDQAYGKPGFQELPIAEWQKRYNTRWVAPLVYRAQATPPENPTRTR